MLDALELLDVQRDRVGLAVHFQRAHRARGRAVGEAFERALEGGLRVLGGLEQLLALGDLVECRKAEVAAVHVDDDRHAAGARLAVHRHRARGAVELAAPRGDAHVVGLEAREGVLRVDVVGHRGGLCGKGRGGQGGGGKSGRDVHRRISRLIVGPCGQAMARHRLLPRRASGRDFDKARLPGGKRALYRRARRAR